MQSEVQQNISLQKWRNDSGFSAIASCSSTDVKTIHRRISTWVLSLGDFPWVDVDGNFRPAMIHEQWYVNWQARLIATIWHFTTLVNAAELISGHRRLESASRSSARLVGHGRRTSIDNRKFSKRSDPMTSQRPDVTSEWDDVDVNGRRNR